MRSDRDNVGGSPSVLMRSNQRKAWRSPQMGECGGTKTRSLEPFPDVIEIVRATSGKQEEVPPDQRGDAFDEGGALDIGILIKDGNGRPVRGYRRDLVEQSLIRLFIKSVDDIAQEDEIVVSSRKVLFLEIAFDEIDSFSNIPGLSHRQSGTLEADRPVEDGRFQWRMLTAEFDAV